MALGTLTAPIGVGLLIGADRRITAAIQLRAGPPLLQPLYDLTKLLAKRSPSTDRVASGLLVAHVVLATGSVALVLAGGDLLAAALVLGAAQMLFVLAAATVESPYAQLGASRELVLSSRRSRCWCCVVIAYALAAGSFSTRRDRRGPGTLLLALPTLGITLAVLLAATLRKSPFDLASSHRGAPGARQGLDDRDGRPLARRRRARALVRGGLRAGRDRTRRGRRIRCSLAVLLVGLDLRPP